MKRRLCDCCHFGDILRRTYCCGCCDNALREEARDTQRGRESCVCFERLWLAALGRTAAGVLDLQCGGIVCSARRSMLNQALFVVADSRAWLVCFAVAHAGVSIISCAVLQPLPVVHRLWASPLGCGCSISLPVVFIKPRFSLRLFQMLRR